MLMVEGGKKKKNAAPQEKSRAYEVERYMKGMIGNGDGKLFLTTFKDRERQERSAEREITVPVRVRGGAGGGEENER